MQISIDTANSMSIARYLGGTGLALWAFVMALMPDPGFMAPWLWMALFWALQIVVGLTILQTILYLMSRVDRCDEWLMWFCRTGADLLANR
jgi:hypothetical protein